MPFQAEKRKYQRCGSIICKLQVSINEKYWENPDIIDLSADGLRFSSNSKFNENSGIFLNLYVYNMLTEFNIKLEGCIIRIDRNNAENQYAIRFENIDKYHRVQLDELVKSKIILSDKKVDLVFGEDNPAALFSRHRPRKSSIKLRNNR